MTEQTPEQIAEQIVVRHPSCISHSGDVKQSIVVAIRAEREQRDTEGPELRQALGLLTTLHPTMEMDCDHPLKMAQAIHAFVSQQCAAALKRAEVAEAEKKECWLCEGTGSYRSPERKDPIHCDECEEDRANLESFLSDTEAWAARQEVRG